MTREDAISRKDLMRHLYDCKITSEGIAQGTIISIENYVEQMPSVTPVGPWYKDYATGYNDAKREMALSGECDVEDIALLKERVKKYRKKAKRFKRKYVALREDISRNLEE